MLKALGQYAIIQISSGSYVVGTGRARLEFPFNQKSNILNHAEGIRKKSGGRKKSQTNRPTDDNPQRMATDSSARYSQGESDWTGSAQRTGNCVVFLILF